VYCGPTPSVPQATFQFLMADFDEDSDCDDVGFDFDADFGLECDSEDEDDFGDQPLKVLEFRWKSVYPTVLALYPRRRKPYWEFVGRLLPNEQACVVEWMRQKGHCFTPPVDALPLADNDRCADPIVERVKVLPVVVAHTVVDVSCCRWDLEKLVALVEWADCEPRWEVVDVLASTAQEFVFDWMVKKGISRTPRDGVCFGKQVDACVAYDKQSKRDFFAGLERERLDKQREVLELVQQNELAKSVKVHEKRMDRKLKQRAKNRPPPQLETVCSPPSSSLTKLSSCPSLAREPRPTCALIVTPLLDLPSSSHVPSSSSSAPLVSTSIVLDSQEILPIPPIFPVLPAHLIKPPDPPPPPLSSVAPSSRIPLFHRMSLIMIEMLFKYCVNLNFFYNQSGSVQYGDSGALSSLVLPMRCYSVFSEIIHTSKPQGSLFSDDGTQKASGQVVSVALPGCYTSAEVCQLCALNQSLAAPSSFPICACAA